MIKDYAKKEMERMKKIFKNLKIKGGKEFYLFAKNYFEDGKYFFKKKKYIEAFEAFVISWAYIDFGLKLNFFEIPPSLKKYFTL